MAVIEKAESSAVFGYIFDCFIGSFHSLRGTTCSQDKTLTVTVVPRFCHGNRLWPHMAVSGDTKWITSSMQVFHVEGERTQPQKLLPLKQQIPTGLIGRNLCYYPFCYDCTLPPNLLYQLNRCFFSPFSLVKIELCWIRAMNGIYQFDIFSFQGLDKKMYWAFNGFLIRLIWC